MSKGKIFIISGPSGSGKTTLHKKLLLSRRLKGKLVKSISATTRPRRLGEREGRDYLFLTQKKFLRKRKAGYFLEWQKVFDSYYGTPKKAVLELLKSGKNVLLCIDVKGARVVERQFSDAIKIFIKGPSLAVLKKRLQKRGSETKVDLKLRLAIARREMLEEKSYDYTVINNNLSKALRDLESAVSFEIQKGRKNELSTA